METAWVSDCPRCKAGTLKSHLSLFFSFFFLEEYTHGRTYLPRLSLCLKELEWKTKHDFFHTSLFLEVLLMATFFAHLPDTIRKEQQLKTPGL